MSKRRSNKSVKLMMYDVFKGCEYSCGDSMTCRQQNLALSWQFNVCGIFWCDYDNESVVVSLTASELKGE